MSGPVAYRVKDFADGWILCHTREVAEHEADGQCLIQPLYAEPTELLKHRIEALEAALRFLLDRLDELDPSDVDVANDFNGHVAPAISRARAALDKDAGQ